MRTPEVDYREFRLSKLNTPQFSHLKLLLGWVGYFALYFLTENLIPLEKCHVIHCGLDDIIPFCEWFILPYVFWYFLVVFSLGWFALYDVDSFKKLQTYIIITQAVAMTIYILLPSRQDLRPEEFMRDNFFSRLMAFIYGFDTSTGVCPSLHAAYSFGIASVWRKKKDASAGFKAFIIITVVLICASVCFVKQHSALDVLAAIPLGVLAEGLVYGKDYWLPRLQAKSAKS